MKNSDVMKLSAWLLQDSAKQGLRLSDESDTPTFYQTLAGVTHCKFIIIIFSYIALKGTMSLLQAKKMKRLNSNGILKNNTNLELPLKKEGLKMSLSGKNNDY